MFGLSRGIEWDERKYDGEKEEVNKYFEKPGDYAAREEEVSKLMCYTKCKGREE